MRVLLLLLLVTFLSCGTGLLAQTAIDPFCSSGRAAATTFVTDYQAIGINPANLGWGSRWPDKKVALGLAELSLSAYSDALTRNQLRAGVYGNDGGFTQERKRAAARDFADKDFMLNVDLMSIGAAYRSEAIGGIGFAIREHAQWNSIFGRLASELFFLGSSSSYFDELVLASGDTVQNSGSLSQTTAEQVVQGIRSGDPLSMSALFDGTRISFVWYREYNLSFGKRLVHNDGLDLYAGIGLKYLSGIGILDLRSDAFGTYSAFSALSPFFKVDYDRATLNTDNSVSTQDGLFPSSVGDGAGMDLGISAIIGQKWKVGASVTNLGWINWKGNVRTANDALVTGAVTAGLDSYNLLAGVNELLSQGGISQWDMAQERKVALPASMRFGAGVLLGQIAEVGVDVLVPLNETPGNAERTMMGIGGDLRPVPWLQLSAGIATGNVEGLKVPVGFTVNVGKGTWEFGAASRDAVTFFAKREPTVSLCLGFLRFRF